MGQDGERSKSDLGQVKTGIFLREGLDRKFGDLPVGQISKPVRQLRLFARRSQPVGRQAGGIGRHRPGTLALAVEGVEAGQQALKCSIYHGSRTSARTLLPALGHGEDALRLNATVPFAVVRRRTADGVSCPLVFG